MVCGSLLACFLPRSCCWKGDQARKAESVTRRAHEVHRGSSEGRSGADMAMAWDEAGMFVSLAGAERVAESARGLGGQASALVRADGAKTSRTAADCGLRRRPLCNNPPWICPGTNN